MPIDFPLGPIVWKIRKHAEATYPDECCGLITNDGRVVPCKNMAADKRHAFQIGDGDSKRVTNSGFILGVYHSHVDQPAYISQADKDGYTGIGLYIVASCLKGAVEDVHIYKANAGKFQQMPYGD
jgi:proteasome lid subunit RPN8/RPN11